MCIQEKTFVYRYRCMLMNCSKILLMHPKDCSKRKKNRKRELKKEGKWGEEREEILLFTLEDIKKELLRRLFCPWLTRRFVSYRLETPLMPFTSLLSPTVPPKCCFVLSPPTARTH